MQIAPINSNLCKNINYTGYGKALTRKIPVSFNPAINIADSMLKRTLVASNLYMCKTIDFLINRIITINIPHKDTKLTTLAWEMKNNDSQKYLIVLHGLSHNISCLQDMYKEILEKTNYSILAPEYTDICSPDRNRKTYSNKTINDDITAAMNYLEEKGIQRKDITVAGHSFGGYIASILANKYQDIEKLILISPTDTFKHCIYSIKIGKEIKISKFAQFMVKNIKFIRSQLESIYGTKCFLKNVKCPVDIIYASNDKLIAQDTINNLAAVCQNLDKVHLLSRGTHQMDPTKIQTVVSILSGNRSL